MLFNMVVFNMGNMEIIVGCIAYLEDLVWNGAVCENFKRAMAITKRDDVKGER